VSYEALALLGTADPTEDIRLAWTPEEEHAIQRATVGYIQRSRGYSLRPALTQEAMAALIAQAKALNPDLIVLVDNCYGEFTEAQEPTAYGADLMAGSLIKNPGGGIVPAGGYVAGRRALVEAAAEALTCPGVGRWGGYTFEQTRLLLQGLFLAPGVVHQTLQGMTLAAAVFDSQGKATFPHWQAPRADIIQVVALDTPEALLHFCRCIQAASPIDAFVRPEPAEVPGYGCPVVMAGGTFIEGATIELSADGPLRPPYTAFLQGGLSYAHVRYALRQWLETTVETETNTDKNISLGASFVYGGSNSINIMQRAF
jgi:cystathionine beta-lyase family protein involved in aluminum resistance